MQNKLYFFFFLKQGFPKGGEGGSNTWEKFPKNPVFLGGGERPLFTVINTIHLSTFLEVQLGAVKSNFELPCPSKLTCSKCVAHVGPKTQITFRNLIPIGQDFTGEELNV